MSTMKRWLKSSRVRGILALIVIGVSVILVLLGGSREADPTVGLGTDPNPPTVGITNPVATLLVNRDTTYRDVHITVTKVQEATAFSDDRKHDGLYTVRVNIHLQPDASLHSTIGIDFASLVSLMLADGQIVAPKLLTIYPVILPQKATDGYIDFPISTSVNLASLTLRIGPDNTISFGS